MSKQSFGFRMVAPDVVWSTNARVHWRTTHKRNKAWKEATSMYARMALLTARREGLSLPDPLPRCEVQVLLGFPTNRRRDPHNYVGTVCKAIVDGLVLAGYWPDDTPEYVTVAEPRIEVPMMIDGHPLMPRTFQPMVYVIISAKESN